jgi:hypothetical protein
MTSDHAVAPIDQGEPDMRASSLLLLALASTLVTGCFGTLQPATATFKGLTRPVLLGPVDRIGGGPALPTRHVAGYDGEATAHYARSESGGMVSESQGFDNLTMVKDAVGKLDQAGPAGDLRVRKVRAWAKGFITMVKNSVRVEGSVVAVEGGK